MPIDVCNQRYWLQALQLTWWRMSSRVAVFFFLRLHLLNRFQLRHLGICEDVRGLSLLGILSVWRSQIVGGSVTCWANCLLHLARRQGARGLQPGLNSFQYNRVIVFLFVHLFLPICRWIQIDQAAVILWSLVQDSWPPLLQECCCFLTPCLA